MIHFTLCCRGHHRLLHKTGRHVSNNRRFVSIPSNKRNIRLNQQSIDNEQTLWPQSTWKRAWRQVIHTTQWPYIGIVVGDIEWNKPWIENGSNVCWLWIEKANKIFKDVIGHIVSFDSIENVANDDRRLKLKQNEREVDMSRSNERWANKQRLDRQSSSFLGWNCFHLILSRAIRTLSRTAWKLKQNQVDEVSWVERWFVRAKIDFQMKKRLVLSHSNEGVGDDRAIVVVRLECRDRPIE